MERARKKGRSGRFQRCIVSINTSHIHVTEVIVLLALQESRALYGMTTTLQVLEPLQLQRSFAECLKSLAIFNSYPFCSPTKRRWKMLCKRADLEAVCQW
eukprot:2904552-Amphidinium_carterae.2